ncbi:MAG: hypothetical protein CL946_10135 [Ectothiorhodospiraceae bacterium]|nr:hypothetical protein [Ectothiorhodospiraceae bacterium]
MTERSVNRKMSPRTKHQIEQIRQESRRKILDAAFLLFGENGYHHTTMAQIARKAAVSKGLTYNYFDGKEDLVKAVVVDAFEKLDEHVTPSNLEQSPGEMLEEITRDSIRTGFEDATYWRLTFSLVLQPDVTGIILPILHEKQAEYLEILGSLFGAVGVADPKLHAQLFIAHLDGISLHHLVGLSALDRAKVTEAIIKMYIPK